MCGAEVGSAAVVITCEVIGTQSTLVPDSDSKDVVWNGLCFLLFWRPLLGPMQEGPNLLPPPKNKQMSSAFGVYHT